MGGGKGGGGSSGGGGTKKTKTYTKAQQMAKARIAAKKEATKTTTTTTKTRLTGRDKLVSLGRAPSDPRNSVAATRFREREAQGLSGLTGKPKPGSTAAMVARDNQMYGNTVPTGSFNISEDGKAQAEANKAEARLKKTFDPSRLTDGTKNAFNASQYGNLYSTKFKLPAVQNLGQNFGNWYNLGKNERIANEATARYGKIGDLFARDTSKVDSRTLFGDDRLQRGMSNRSYKEGKQSKWLGRPDRAFGIDLSESWKQKKLVKVPAVEGGPMSGPTPLIRRLVTDIGKFALSPKAALLASNFRVDPLADGTLEGKPTRFNIDAGGLNVGTKEEATTKGDPTGRTIGTIGNTLTKFTNPLANATINTLGAIDAFTNDRTDLDRKGALTIFGREVKPYNLASDAAMIGGKVLKGDLSIGDVAEGASDAYNTFTADNKAKAFFKNYDADDFMKSLDVAKESKVVQNQLEKEGFPSDVKKQIANTFEGLKEEASKIEQGKVHDRALMKTRVDEINNLLANINKNPKLSTLSKVIGQFDPKTNENAANMKVMDKIKAGFDPSSPNALALSAKDRGVLEGSGGNLLIGGKMSDIYKEAATQIPKGQIGLSSEDMFNIAKNTYENIHTEGSLSAQRAGEIASLVGPKGVTPGSLIRGVLPQIGRRGGGGNTVGSNLTTGGSGSVPVEELLINQTPTTTTTAPTQTVGDAGNLADLQRQAYLRQLASYGFNPNYFAQVRPRFNTKPKSFSDYFRRTT